MRRHKVGRSFGRHSVGGDTWIGSTWRHRASTVGLWSTSGGIFVCSTFSSPYWSSSTDVRSRGCWPRECLTRTVPREVNVKVKDPRWISRPAWLTGGFVEAALGDDLSTATEGRVTVAALWSPTSGSGCPLTQRFRFVFIATV